MAKYSLIRAVYLYLFSLLGFVLLIIAGKLSYDFGGAAFVSLSPGHY